MSTPAPERELTAEQLLLLQQIEQQRQDQLALARSATAAFVALWPLFQRGLQVGDLAAWFLGLARIGQEYAAASWVAARQRYEGDRLQAGVPGRAPAFRPIDLDTARLWGSMRALLDEATAAVAEGKADRIDTPQVQRRMAQSFQRHTLEPGRRLVHDAVDEAAALRAQEPGVDLDLVDRRLVGYIRTTDGDPCDFCAMLASRGAVYASPESALLRADGEKYHDGCGCLAVAVWTTDPTLPEINEEMRELWYESQRNPPPGERLDQQVPRPGSDALADVASRRSRNNFRRALAARRRANRDALRDF